MDFDVARIHPFIKQIDHLALARALNTGDQDQRGEFAVLLEVVLRIEQRLTQLQRECLLLAERLGELEKTWIEPLWRGVLLEPAR